MWSSGLAPHGHCSGKGWREQVMTRQPAAEKRLTVAWPMPRLAPVRSNVRRGWLGVAMIYFISRIESRLGPRRAQIRPRKCNTIVQPVEPLLPELDLDRHHPVARPE